MRPCVCEDCGAPYETLGLDIVLPDDQWEMIYPGSRGGGILCGSCIAKRAAKLPCATVIHAYIEFAPVGPGLQARIFTVAPDTPVEGFSLSNYMCKLETWAEAYDQEAVVMSPEEFEALYDDAFFEAMELEKTLP